MKKNNKKIIKMYDYYCDIIGKLKKDSNLFFSEFLWPAAPNLNVKTSSINYEYFYLKKHGNIFKAFFFLIKAFINSIKSKKKSEEVIGNIIKKTNVIILTWLFRKDIKTIKNGIDVRYWKNIKLKFEKDKIHSQYLAFLMFDPTKKEKEELAAANIICVNQNSFYSRTEIVVNLFFNMIIIAKTFLYFKRFDQLLYFYGSIFQKRYSISVQLKKYFYSFFKKNKNISNIIIPWENQPEQKAIVSAANNNNIHTCGYIHSCVNNNYLYLYKQKNYKSIWEPDKIFVHGTDYNKMLNTIGWSDNDIEIIKSIRYEKLLNPEFFLGKVFLPYNVDKIISYLDIIFKLQKEGIVKVKELRMHPAVKKTKLINDKIKKIRINIDSKDVIVCGFSTVIIEAVEQGVEVLQLIDKEDSLDVIEETAYPHIEREKIHPNIIKLSMKKKYKGSYINTTYPRTIIDVIKDTL